MNPVPTSLQGMSHDDTGCSTMKAIPPLHIHEHTEIFLAA